MAGLRGLTAATVLGSLLFPAHIGQWVALDGFGLGWILSTFVSHKQPAVNFPHLLERLNGLVIIFFGETVIDIVPYFHAAKFEIGTLPVIVILFAMFTVYVMQFSYFIDEHKAQNSGALPSYSHYAVLIGIALATVALAWLHQNSTATAESARMLWLGLGVFYLGVAAQQARTPPPATALDFSDDLIRYRRRAGRRFTAAAPCYLNHNGIDDRCDCNGNSVF